MGRRACIRGRAPPPTSHLGPLGWGWGATGVVLVAALSVLIFGEHLSPVSIAGIAVIIVGVVLVETGTHDQSAPAAERAA